MIIETEKLKIISDSGIIFTLTYLALMNKNKGGIWKFLITWQEQGGVKISTPL